MVISVGVLSIGKPLRRWADLVAHSRDLCPRRVRLSRVLYDTMGSVSRARHGAHGAHGAAHSPAGWLPPPMSYGMRQWDALSSTSHGVAVDWWVDVTASLRAPHDRRQ